MCGALHGHRRLSGPATANCSRITAAVGTAQNYSDCAAAGEEERPLKAIFGGEVESLLEAGLEPSLVTSLLDNLQPPTDANAGAARRTPGLGPPLEFSVILASPPRNGDGTLKCLSVSLMHPSHCKHRHCALSSP